MDAHFKNKKNLNQKIQYLSYVVVFP